MGHPQLSLSDTRLHNKKLNPQQCRILQPCNTLPPCIFAHPLKVPCANKRPARHASPHGQGKTRKSPYATASLYACRILNTTHAPAGPSYVTVQPHASHHLTLLGTLASGDPPPTTHVVASRTWAASQLHLFLFFLHACATYRESGAEGRSRPKKPSSSSTAH